MNLFKVFIEWNGALHTRLVSAETPDAAAKNMRKDYPGCVVIKVKLDRSDTNH